jgi:hypothetical protein
MQETNFLMDQFIGRFHPLLVHLPVGFLVLLGLLELLATRPRFKHLAGASRAILVATLPVALVSVLTGWLLAGGGEYHGDLLFQHRWAGVAVAVGTLALLIVHQRHQVRLYRWMLVGVLALVCWTGHQGGSLTHGSDYLARHAPQPLRRILGGKPAAGPQGDSAYARVIHPIMDRYCASCHNAEKVKGGLRVDTYERLLAGGDNGPVIVPGKSAESEFLRRAQLPLEHDDHMPPDGKPQPTTEELKILAWWIDRGASASSAMTALEPTPEILAMIEALKQPRAAD